MCMRSKPLRWVKLMKNGHEVSLSSNSLSSSGQDRKKNFQNWSSSKIGYWVCWIAWFSHDTRKIEIYFVTIEVGKEKKKISKSVKPGSGNWVHRFGLASQNHKLDQSDQPYLCSFGCSRISIQNCSKDWLFCWPARRRRKKEEKRKSKVCLAAKSVILAVCNLTLVDLNPGRAICV